MNKKSYLDKNALYIEERDATHRRMLLHQTITPTETPKRMIWSPLSSAVTKRIRLGLFSFPLSSSRYAITNQHDSRTTLANLNSRPLPRT